MTHVEILARLEQIKLELSVPTTRLWYGADLERERTRLEDKLVLAVMLAGDEQ